MTHDSSSLPGIDPTIPALVQQALADGVTHLSAVLGRVLPFVDDEDTDSAIEEVTDLVSPYAKPGQYARPWAWIPGTALQIEELELDPAPQEGPADSGPPRLRPVIPAKSSRLTLDLPAEFVELCERHGVKPEEVLRGFIADLCGIMNWAANPRPDGYSSNGSDERRLAREYYDRCGYPFMSG